MGRSPSPGRRKSVILAALVVALLIPPSGGRTESPCPRPFQQTPDRPPFDISYLPTDPWVVIAMRPAAVFRGPAMEKYAALVNDFFARLDKKGQPALLPIQDMEQVVGALLVSEAKSAGGEVDLFLGPIMVRSRQGRDWKGQLTRRCGKTVEVKYRGRVYYRTRQDVSSLLLPLHLVGIPPDESPGLCFLVPDEHTLVFGREEALRRMLRGTLDRRRMPAAAQWRQVECGVLAALADEHLLDYALKKDSKTMPYLLHAKSFVLGFDYLRAEAGKEASFAIHAFAPCGSTAAADKAVEEGKVCLEKARESFAANMQCFPRRPALDRFQEGLLRQARPSRQGCVADLRTEVRFNEPAVWKAILSDPEEQQAAPPSEETLSEEGTPARRYTDEPAGARQPLLGEWKLVSVQEGGKPVPRSEWGGMGEEEHTLTFGSDEATWKDGPYVVSVLAYKVDTASSPHRLAFGRKDSADLGEGDTIFQLDGDCLKLASFPGVKLIFSDAQGRRISKDEPDRPTDLHDPRATVCTYRRIKR